MTVPPRSTPSRPAPRLVSARRGVLEWVLPSEDATGGLREMAQRFFSVGSVKKLQIRRSTGRLRVEYDFSADRATVLAGLSSALRGVGREGLPEIAQAAVEGPVVNLAREGGVISSWKIRERPGRRIECRHDALFLSPAAPFTVEQAVALLRGVRRAQIDRRKGVLMLWVDREHFRKEVLVSALEAAISADRPTAEFLPPTRRGYSLDAAQIASAAAGAIMPGAFLPLSFLLLVICYHRQIADALDALRKGRADWNTVVASVVVLTAWNNAFFPAALMSLALRSWKTLEHWRILDVLGRMRLGGLSAMRTRWVARAAFSLDDSGRRSVRVANSAAWPVLVFGAVGFAVGGPVAALAAVRPDFLTSPRLGNRLESLRALAECAKRGVSLSRLSLCGQFLRARHVLLHAECGEETGAAEFLGWNIQVSRISGQEDFDRAVRELPQGVPTPIYVGPPMGWSPEDRSRVLWCQPDPDEIGAWREDADAHFEVPLDLALEAILRESRLHAVRRSRLETIPLAGNGLLSLGGALAGVAPWMISIATNAITASVWVALRGGWPTPPAARRTGSLAP